MQKVRLIGHGETKNTAQGARAIGRTATTSILQSSTTQVGLLHFARARRFASSGGGGGCGDFARSSSPRSGTGFLAPAPHSRTLTSEQKMLSSSSEGLGTASDRFAAICASAGLASLAGVWAARCGGRPYRTLCLAKKKGGGGGGGGAEEGQSCEELVATSRSRGSCLFKFETAGDVDIDTEAIVADFEEKMKKSVVLLEDNLRTIRAGKATPSLLDSVKVNAYESVLKLEEVATVTATASDTTTLMVNVFDETVVGAVVKAIQTADLGFTASEMGQSVKVNIPPLTKEKRVQYVKLAKDYAEKSKVAVRNVRQAAMKKIKSFNKKLPEDTVRAMTQEVEDFVKKSVADIEAQHHKEGRRAIEWIREAARMMGGLGYEVSPTPAWICQVLAVVLDFALQSGLDVPEVTVAGQAEGSDFEELLLPLVGPELWRLEVPNARRARAWVRGWVEFNYCRGANQNGAAMKKVGLKTPVEVRQSSLGSCIKFMPPGSRQPGAGFDGLLEGGLEILVDDATTT
ncbi:frr, partial [Symbiodinium microadriaticum]